MADKKYIDFPAGTYDPTKILLQADPSTGALEKIEMSTMLNQRFGLEDNTATEDRTFTLDTNNFDIQKTEAGFTAGASISSASGITAASLFSTSGTTQQTFIAAYGHNAVVATGNVSSFESATMFLDGPSIHLDTSNFDKSERTRIAMDGSLIELYSTSPVGNVRIALADSIITLDGLLSFSDNAAAIAGGIPYNGLYHQSGLLAIVI